MPRQRSLASLAALLIILAACGLPTPGGASQGETGPIKIGLIAPTTGNAAASGTDMNNGWNLYWKGQSNKVSGREVQTFSEDTGGDPTVALTKARLLIEQRQVDILVGPLFANEGLAIADYVQSTGTPWFNPIVSADDLTQRHRVDVQLRVAGWTSSQPHHPFGEWAYDQGYRKVATICSDYAFGQEVCGGFVQTFTNKGGTVVGQLWNPINTADFSSYLSQLKGMNVDAVFSSQVGADSPRFVKQWNDFGLKGKIPLLGGEVLLDQSLLRSMGPEAEGLISAGHYAEGRDSKAARDFDDLYLKTYNQLPGYYAAALYTAAQWIADAVQKNGGSVSDHKKFLDVVKNITLDDSPIGPMKLDTYGNPVENAYVRQVQRRPDGKLWNVPIKTYTNVSQFWTFDPATYLKQPVYSRDFQGIKK